MTEFERIIVNTDCIEKLKNSTVMITGTTGTIGMYLLKLLLYYNAEHRAGIRIVCPVRNLSKLYHNLKNVDGVHWLEYDFISELRLDYSVDFLIHCAGPTRIWWSDQLIR